MRRLIATLVALVNLGPRRLPGDISASSRYYERDILTSPIEVTGNGLAHVPDGVGLGVALDLEYLDRQTVNIDRFTPS